MLCKNVLPLLSGFHDKVMDADASVQVSQHLDQCILCRKELESLSVLQGKLRSLKGIEAPEFLGSLVEHRIAEIEKNSWRRNLRNELERMWSIIRTTDSTWYITKALGTVMTSLFFFLICSNNMLLSPPNLKQPVINDDDLNKIAEIMSQSGKDDALTVLAKVDPSGSGKVQNVIERPNDQRLLNNVNEMIAKAHYRPASKNGKAIPSDILFIFRTISVYD
jgi:hypothetical protein